MWGEGTPGKNRGPRGDKAVLQEPGSQYRGCAAESDRGLALSRHQRAGREELVRGGGWALGAGSGAQAVELPQPTPQLHGGQPNWAWPQTTNLCFWVARGLPVWPRPCREEPRGSPRPHATAVPRTPPPSQAFWKPRPPQPERAPRWITSHCRGCNVVVVGGGREPCWDSSQTQLQWCPFTPKMTLGHCASVCLRTLPHPYPSRAGLFSLLCRITTTQASKPMAGWWGGGHSGDHVGLRVHPARPPGSRCHHGQ